jgi:hypothetical protein
MMFSQSGDKESTPPPAHSAAPEQTGSNGYGSLLFGLFILLLIVGFAALLVFLVIPEGAKNNLRQSIKHL